MHDVTSMTLIGRLRVGNDSAAWSRFNSIYSGLIQGWLRRRGVPADIADDVCQDVLTKVFEEIKRFDHNGRVGAFRNWLRMIMRHRLRTVQRRTWRAGERPLPDWSGIADQLEDDESDLTRLWDEEHDAYLLRRLLEMVAPEFKEHSLVAFRRVVLEGEDVTVVANALSMSPNAVRIAQSRVLAALRRVGEGIVS
jgi:RNA polymerase sigma factor (sigma-70 family)